MRSKATLWRVGAALLILSVASLVSLDVFAQSQSQPCIAINTFLK